VEEGADVELGLAEEGGLVGGGEGACEGEEFLIECVAEGLVELLGLRLAFGGEGRMGHARASVA
jgi:hypothetical protein